MEGNITISEEKIRSVLCGPAPEVGGERRGGNDQLVGGHVREGSTLVHDGEAAHKTLIEKLSLKSRSYPSKGLKKLPDRENPLDPVKRIHAVLKNFLDSHSGFLRSELQNWLNLFAFISNPPKDFLEKVDLFINFAFQNPKSLRYRDFFGSTPDIDP